MSRSCCSVGCKYNEVNNSVTLTIWLRDMFYPKRMLFYECDEKFDNPLKMNVLHLF